MPTISEALAIALAHQQAGRLDVAERIYRYILQTQRDQVDAIHLLGVIAQRMGRDDEAIACYRRAVELKPDFAEGHYNLGNAQKGQGNLDEAVACYRRTLELKPDFGDAHNNLGVTLKDQGATDEAIAHWRRALVLMPDCAPAHSNLGLALKEQGKFDEAIACYRRALELKPDIAEAHNNLGAVFKDQGRLDEALVCYRRALDLKPDFVEAHINLGALLKEQGKLDETIACYRRALELNPDFAEAHGSLGNALKDQGKLEEALACYRRALELKPDSAEVLINLGAAFQEQGKLDDAIECYRRAAAGCRRVLEIRPQSDAANYSLGKALGQLAFSLEGRLPRDDVTAMRQLLSEGKVRGEVCVSVEFGLARAFDAAGDYAQAAVNLRQANARQCDELRRRNRQYNPAENRAFVDGLIEVSTPQFFAEKSGFGLETEVPVFMFGLPRSGTTLAEQILASHSQVFGAGEPEYCEEAFQSLPVAMARRERPMDCFRDLDRQTAFSIAQRHLERLQGLSPSALRIVDKMPDNYHFLGLIALLFPRARLIHCRRDLRDTALSCFATNFAKVAWAYDPDHIAARFAEYRRLMDHWQKVLPLPVLNVDYEEMVDDCEGISRRMLAWCGLEWEAACLKFHETRRTVRTASAVQVRQPIYKSSVGRWKNYERALGDLFARVQGEQ